MTDADDIEREQAEQAGYSRGVAAVEHAVEQISDQIAARFYLRYDHSAGPGPRDDEFIGPFPSGSAALQFRSERFAAGAPVTLEVMDERPPEAFTMTPEAAAR